MISILSDIGNKAYALPMVQAYPTDVNAAQLLAWSPADQALAYVPYTGNSSGDFGVGRDLAVGRDLSIIGDVLIGDDLVVIGDATLPSVLGSVGIAGAVNIGTTYSVAGTKVVEARKTGWVVMTGTAGRATKATASVTLPELAGIVMALQQDLISHGLIGT